MSASKERFQSFNWMRGVFDDKRISIVHRLVLARLCLHRNSGGQCSPGYDIIAEELGVHRATIFRAVEVAVRLGWLAQPVRHGRTVADFIFTFPPNVAPERHQEADNIAPEQHQESPKVAAVQSQSRTGANTKSQRQRASSEKSRASPRNGSLNGIREQERERVHARQIPDDWVPTEQDLQFAIREGLSLDQAQRQGLQFRDYWRSKGTTRVDWSATWRSWIRREADRRPNTQRGEAARTTGAESAVEGIFKTLAGDRWRQ